MTAVDDLIADLRENRISDRDQPVVCNIDVLIAALQELRIGEPIAVTTFTANGTWTKNPNARTVKVELIGGGGGAASGASGRRCRCNWCKRQQWEFR
jgi:hypothetical protein